MNRFPFIVALALATVGAAVSLYGLVLMFGIYFLPIGAGLEAGKLTSAATLHHNWTRLGWRVRYALGAIVVVLMVLTSSGIYGFTLTRYLAHVAAITGPMQEKIAAADQAVIRQAQKIADLDKQIGQVDAEPALEVTSTARPRTAAQINAAARAQAEATKARIADQARRRQLRDGLAARRDVEAGELARLRTVRTEVGAQAQAAESEVGPVKLIADLVGVDPGKVVAAAVASVYDLLCILLLLVASHKPAEPVVDIKPAAPAKATTAKRKASRRSYAAHKAWETRKANARKAALKRGPQLVH